MARRFVVGTAGHVDHGKTTLVHALTGVDTDRLPEEKRRGITIELGFASWRLPDGTEVSLIDVPGHRRFVHTMIAGAAGIELVLLVVAADEGVMPQTREHIAACELLGIKRAVVAVTKADRVERDLAVLAGEEVAELLEGRFEREVVVCSAKTGAGLDDLRAAVQRALAALPPRGADAPAHLSIDRIFSVKGAGTVVTGTLVRGELAVGQSVRIVGGSRPRPVLVRGLHVHDRAEERVRAPSRLAINLASVEIGDLSRGDVVSADDDLATTQRFDAELTLLREVKPAAAVEVYVGTARSPGRLQILRRPEATEEAPGPLLGRIRLERPIPVSGLDRFVLRAGSVRGPAGAVLGGGSVIDARPPPGRDRKRRVASLLALASGDAQVAARALAAERAPRALQASELGSRFPMDAATLARAADKLADRGDLVRIKDEGFADRASLARLAQSARAMTSAHHASHPFDRGIKLETLRQKLGERAGVGVAAEAIRLAARKSLEGEVIVVEGDSARLEGFVEGGGRKPGGPLDVARLALDAAGLKGLGEFALTELLALPAKEVKPVLAKLVRDGLLVTAGGQWFAKDVIDALRARVLAHFATTPVLTIAQFKDMSGLGRKQAIPLLELFDREGTSARKGDDRVPGPKGKPSAEP